MLVRAATIDGVTMLTVNLCTTYSGEVFVVGGHYPVLIGFISSLLGSVRLTS